MARKKTSSVKFAKRAKRGTVYQYILDGMAGLTKGYAIEIDIPKGIKPGVFHNRLNAALHRFPVKPPARCQFRKRTLGNGKQIAIYCETRPR